MLPIVAAIFCIACSSPQEKIVEFPLADLSNTTTVFVSKVALTDSATVLSVEARYIPHYWIRISSDSYLMADGRKYLMTGADGIKPDENFWMPESGKASFSLTFEPLPLRTDAIIAPYRGKVVLVDFWNTWCAPCRAAIESVEPMKEHELADDDMVWIYIANETSPLVKYKEMISGIKGIHYRLSPDRWGYLCDKFDIDGIPSYVLVDRSGKYSLRNDFRNHDTLKKTLSSMLDR